MSITTVRPDEFIVGSNVTLVGDDEVSAISDDSDASYLRTDGFDWHRTSATVGFAEPTIPAGDLLKEFRLRARLSMLFGTTIIDSMTCCGKDLPSWSGSGLVTPTTIELGRAVIPSVPSAVQLAFSMLVGGLGSTIDTAQLHELYIDFVHVEQPVVVVDSPSDTVETTSFPAVTWTNTLDTDGGAQSRYRVKIYTAAQLGAAGFDPDISPPLIQSGTQVGAESSWTPDEPVPNSIGNRAYVQVAQVVNAEAFWSDWAYSDFDMDTPVPAIPASFNAQGQDSEGRIRLEIEPGVGGDVVTSGAQIQHSVDGGESWEDVRTTRSDGLVDQGEVRENLCTNPKGYSATTGWTSSGLVTFGAGNNVSGLTGAPADTAFGLQADTVGDNARYAIDLTNGQEYTFSAYVWVPSDTGVWVLELRDGSGTLKATSDDAASTAAWTRLNIGFTADSTGTWTLRLVCTGDIPTTTASLTAVLIEEGGVLGSYFDGDTTTAGWTGTPNDSTSQFPFPDDPEQPSLGVVYDYEVPNGQAVLYRARARYNSDTIVSASEWIDSTPSPVSWASDDCWLKHPTTPALNLRLELGRMTSYPGRSKAARQGVFQALGAEKPVVISDTRGAQTGKVQFRLDDTDEREALDALLDSTAPLLLQVRSNDGEPDRWIAVGDQDRARVFDKSFTSLSFEDLPWTEVERPAGSITAWPSDEESEEPTEDVIQL